MLSLAGRLATLLTGAALHHVMALSAAGQLDTISAEASDDDDAMTSVLIVALVVRLPRAFAWPPNAAFLWHAKQRPRKALWGQKMFGRGFEQKNPAQAWLDLLFYTVSVELQVWVAAWIALGYTFLGEPGDENAPSLKGRLLWAVPFSLLLSLRCLGLILYYGVYQHRVDTPWFEIAADGQGIDHAVYAGWFLTLCIVASAFIVLEYLAFYWAGREFATDEYAAPINPTWVYLAAVVVQDIPQAILASIYIEVSSGANAKICSVYAQAVDGFVVVCLICSLIGIFSKLAWCFVDRHNVFDHLPEFGPSKCDCMAIDDSILEGDTKSGGLVRQTSFAPEENQDSSLDGAFEEPRKIWKAPAPAESKGSSVHLMAPKAGQEKHTSEFFDADKGGAFISPEELKKVMVGIGETISDEELDALVLAAGMPCRLLVHKRAVRRLLFVRVGLHNAMDSSAILKRQFRSAQRVYVHYSVGLCVFSCAQHAILIFCANDTLAHVRLIDILGLVSFCVCLPHFLRCRQGWRWQDRL